MFYFDTPYGLFGNRLKWDQQITSTDMDMIFKQFNTQQQSKTCVAVLFHKPTDSTLIANVLTEAAFQELTHLYWHKTNHFTSTPVSSYTSSVEMLTIGFKPNRQNCNWQMETDPRARHNFFDLPPVTTYTKDEKGDPINICEKPPALAKKIISNHVPVGGNVLIVGAGAGGDILGALQAGVNVVALERDYDQYSSLHKAMEHKATQELALLGKEQAEEKQSKLEKEKKSGHESTSGSVSSIPSDTSTSSASTSSQISEKPCADCGEALEKGYDPNIKCSKCPDDGPMHDKCAPIHTDGQRYCATCLEKVLKAAKSA